MMTYFDNLYFTAVLTGVGLALAVIIIIPQLIGMKPSSKDSDTTSDNQSTASENLSTTSENDDWESEDAPESYWDQNFGDAFLVDLTQLFLASGDILRQLLDKTIALLSNPYVVAFMTELLNNLHQILSQL